MVMNRTNISLSSMDAKTCIDAFQALEDILTANEEGNGKKIERVLLKPILKGNFHQNVTRLRHAFETAVKATT